MSLHPNLWEHEIFCINEIMLFFLPKVTLNRKIMQYPLLPSMKILGRATVENKFRQKKWSVTHSSVSFWRWISCEEWAGHTTPHDSNTTVATIKCCPIIMRTEVYFTDHWSRHTYTLSRINRPQPILYLFIAPDRYRRGFRGIPIWKQELSMNPIWK